MHTHTVSPELQVDANPGKHKQIPRAEHSAKCLQKLCARCSKGGEPHNVSQSPVPMVTAQHNLSSSFFLNGSEIERTLSFT